MNEGLIYLLYNTKPVGLPIGSTFIFESTELLVVDDVEDDGDVWCEGCYFFNQGTEVCEVVNEICRCDKENRIDGVGVIFKKVENE